MHHAASTWQSSLSSMAVREKEVGPEPRSDVAETHCDQNPLASVLKGRNRRTLKCEIHIATGAVTQKGCGLVPVRKYGKARQRHHHSGSISFWGANNCAATEQSVRIRLRTCRLVWNVVDRRGWMLRAPVVCQLGVPRGMQQLDLGSRTSCILADRCSASGQNIQLTRTPSLSASP